MIKEAIERLMQAGAKESGARLELNDGGEPYLISPGGSVTKMAEYFPPRRVRQQVVLMEAGSFADYVKRFKTEATLIFAEVSERGAKFRAIMDYHRPHPAGNAVPDYCAHVALFETQATPDWAEWTEANGEAMGQIAFANWLEDYQHLFVEPTGAELLELVRDLHGKKDATFKTAIRLDNGAYSVGYDENIELQSRSGSGSMELPKQLVAGIKVFEGGETYRVTARLKTRIEDRRLCLFFETIRKEAIVRDNIMSVCKLIAEQTGIIPLLGR